jgi:hypothetical protein
MREEEQLRIWAAGTLRAGVWQDSVPPLLKLPLPADAPYCPPYLGDLKDDVVICDDENARDPWPAISCHFTIQYSTRLHHHISATRANRGKDSQSNSYSTVTESRFFI